MKRTIKTFVLLSFLSLVSGSCYSHNGYVDLGLSVKWATCNVGANSPEGYGKYYTFDDALQLEKDGKRLPSKSEIQELIGNCNWTWTTKNGVNGYEVTSKKNGNSIFLPAAGNRNGNDGSFGEYWSGTARDDVGNAYSLFVCSFDVYTNHSYRDNGQSVRFVQDVNHIGYVDLGLGVKWATCNVGANTPEGYGEYYTFDDAQNLGGGGERVPTYEELVKLKDNCDWTWTTKNGVKGYKVTSRKNGNSVFLPAAGYRDGTDVDNVGFFGRYWSSSAYDDGSTSYLDFDSYDVDTGSYGYRDNEQSVRLVQDVNHNEYVDLGLSVKWATCNVGANSPEGYGEYYTFDDAQKLGGGGGRVPTYEELAELKNNCDWTWTVNGYKVTSKKNGNSIFLPAAGRGDGTSVYYEDSRGYYWSSSAYDYDETTYLIFEKYGGVGTLDGSRLIGQSVRLVQDVK